MQRISFSINKTAIETLRRLSKRTCLAQWKLLTLGINLLAAQHQAGEVRRDRMFRSALKSIHPRHKKTLRSLAQ